MTAPTPRRPHLWVIYPYAPGDAEICTLCSEFQTPENAEEDCPETFPEIDSDPPEMPAAADQAEPADGSDDEQRQGAIKP